MLTSILVTVSIIFLIVITIESFYFTWLAKQYVDVQKIRETYNRLDKNLEVLNRAKEEAFRKIYYQDILIYQANKRSLSQAELDKLSKEFIKLTFDICGETVRNELISFFGLESLSIELKNYFMIEYIYNSQLKNV